MTNKKIFVACDVSSQKKIKKLLSLIQNDISGIKIGLQYITQRSPKEIRELSKFKKPIFYDGKFFDIKNTLVESIKSLKKLNISYATVHLLNGLDALKAANKEAKKINIKLLGVSILTSFADKDLISLGFKGKVQDQVLRLIKIAKQANLHGVICSPLEVKMIKSLAPNLKCFTPGIRQGGTKNDQKRTLTAKEALDAGSDYLIIGRPITKGNPKKNIKKILSSLK
ncbi:MAG: orotidine-5'-phosphate decarboxylase [Pelagibacteraceae bacterium]|nr:orotidine-5'-phosphate decarboxylase [Pelagibacteraceae bacterium]PHX88956.1 MAG: orotidine-5'-phosphate decarboxylase [Pelagibacteraceae bacterium]